MKSLRAGKPVWCVSPRASARWCTVPPQRSSWIPCLLLGLRSTEPRLHSGLLPTMVPGDTLACVQVRCLSEAMPGLAKLEVSFLRPHTEGAFSTPLLRWVHVGALRASSTGARVGCAVHEARRSVCVCVCV